MNKDVYINRKFSRQTAAVQLSTANAVKSKIQDFEIWAIVDGLWNFEIFDCPVRLPVIRITVSFVTWQNVIIGSLSL